MILDRLSNWAMYVEPKSRLGRAMHYLSRDFDPELPDGRYDVDGDNIFALVQSYNTRPVNECRFESHQRYIDIQYMIQGGEGMGWAATPTLEVVNEYDPDKDVAFYEQPEFYTTLEVYQGNFALFYPGDAHQPGMNLKDTQRIRKVVMKILL